MITTESPSNRAPRRGRPKSLEKRDAIRRAAGELFLRDGFERTTMDGIARQARVSKQTVYSHFNSKEDLFTACIRGKAEEHGVLMDHTPTTRPLREALEELGNHYLKLLSDEQVLAMYRLMIASGGEHPGMAALFFEAGPQQTMSSLSRFLNERSDGVEWDFGDSAEASELFFVMIQGMHKDRLLLNQHPGLTEGQRQRHVRRVVDRFLRLYGNGGAA